MIKQMEMGFVRNITGPTGKEIEEHKIALVWDGYTQEWVAYRNIGGSIHRETFYKPDEAWKVFSAWVGIALQMEKEGQI